MFMETAITWKIQSTEQYKNFQPQSGFKARPLALYAVHDASKLEFICKS